MKKYALLLFLICGFSTILTAQTTDSVKHRKFVKNGRMYGSWGYNEEWYTHSNIHVSQPSLGNDYTFENLQGHDRIGWNYLAQWGYQLTIPQYNYRFGYFFDEKQLWAIELNFDHTKYIVTQGYLAIVDGKFRGRNVDTAVMINNNSIYWQLNNGANWFLFNIVRRFNITKTTNNKLVIYALVKGGIGPTIPHVDDLIFGDQNNPHFQIGGINAGIEALIRFTFFDHIYLEYCNKVDYANYWGLRIADNGTASQSFGAYEMILNLGLTLHAKKTAGTYTAR
jgi:hypothetical protein